MHLEILGAVEDLDDRALAHPLAAVRSRNTFSDRVLAHPQLENGVQRDQSGREAHHTPVGQSPFRDRVVPVASPGGGYVDLIWLQLATFCSVNEASTSQLNWCASGQQTPGTTMRVDIKNYSHTLNTSSTTWPLSSSRRLHTSRHVKVSPDDFLRDCPKQLNSVQM